MRKKKQKPDNLSLAVVFFLLVGGLIFISLFFKTVVLFEESRFDGSNTFSVLFSERNLNQIVYFSPQTPSISILNFENYKANDIAKSLEIPIDGEILSEEKINNKNLSSILFKKLFNFKLQKDINFIDFFRLYNFSKGVSENLITEKTITKNISSQDLSSIISSSFIDPALSGEKQNIEVINSTEVPGLGNRLANLISNIGGNVILVTTGENGDKSQIQYVKKTYTVKRLSQILELPTINTEKKSIPDVIIVIGKDSLSKFKF